MKTSAIYLATALAFSGTALQAQVYDRAIHMNLSVSSPEEDNSVEAELAAFEVASGYEISLFADESDGIANPITMRWGPRGRLWVLCSQVYPQIVPTEDADDKLFILEDTDGDGRADKSTVFVDELHMPTGFALGDGGVYIGVGQDLIFLRDSNGDDRADHREIVATGFGTGDTHQNINSFSWSPDGELLFCQGLHSFSRVETAWGIVRLDEHGVWRMRPRRNQFHAFRGGSGQNPWGIAFGQWGEPFVKGNSPALSELLPIMVPTDQLHPPIDIGNTQIKSMMVEIIDSPSLPEDIQGNILIAGYFARNIDRMKLIPEASGHRTENLPSLLRSKHRSFRPVDIRTGPDGALYIADWFNPIIGHYQASFRHPDRDEAHGRIWKITAKGNALKDFVDLTELSISALLDRLKTEPLRERERTREELSSRDSNRVIPAIETWVNQLHSQETRYEHHLFEALSVSAWHEAVNESLLLRLLGAQSARARAFATRLVGRWQDRLPNPMALLETSIADADPRVRLEAVVALSYLPNPEAMVLATQALDRPIDRFIQAALTQTSHALKPLWWPAVMEGKLKFENSKHLAFALRQTGGAEALEVVRSLLENQELDSETEIGLITLLVEIGNPADLFWALVRADGKVSVLESLLEDFGVRGKRPVGDLAPALSKLIDSEKPEIGALAIRLAGTWKVEALTNRIHKFVTDRNSSDPLRSAAIFAFGKLKGHEAIDTIVSLASAASSPAIRSSAVEILCDLNLPLAAKLANELLRNASSEEEARDLVTPFIGLTEGPGELANALEEEAVPPELATRIRSVLGAAGRFHARLDHALRPAEQTGLVGMPDFSEAFVGALSSEAKQYGNIANGAKIYASAGLSCTACHKIDNEGGFLGPELTAVGSGVPVELLVEAILWPQRQIKEGFVSTSITTKSGRAISGYLENNDKQNIVIRDAATGVTHTIPAQQILTREDAGSLMPPGLTSGLTRSELRDLIRYLSELKG